MSDKFYVGLDLISFQDNKQLRPVSRVTLNVDSERVLTAGDDTGLELVADCPHATQAMVNSILAQVKGAQYQMYEAADANIDPAAELGDGITVNRVYSVISRIADDGSGFPSLSAPGQAELEDEYPSGGPMTQAIQRKIAETRSTISKTAEEIRLEVEKVNDNMVELSSSFSVELGKITGTVQDTNGNLSKLEQSLKSITLSVENGSTASTIKLLANGAVISSQNISMNGLVTYTGLSNGTTTIDGGCIKTGKIDADRLNLTGKITFSDLNSSTQSTINSASSNASSALSAANTAANTVGQWTYKGTTYIDGTKIMADTIVASKLKGGVVELLNASGSVAAQIGLNGKYNETTGRMLLSSYLVSTTGVFNPRSTVFFGDFDSNDYAGRISPFSDAFEIIGNNGRKIKLCYEGAEGSGGTFKELLTIGYDTVTFDYNGSHTVHCYNNLDMHNYSVLNSSDERLKENIQKAEISALDIINAIQTYSFDWREDGKHEPLGFVAQQLETVEPGLVDVSQSDGHYSTKDLKLIPYLVKAVQELSERVKKLEEEAQNGR